MDKSRENVQNFGP